MSAPRRTWLLRALLVLLSLGLSLGLAEGALRALGLGYGHAPLVDHPVFHHWHPTNHRMRVWTTTGEFGGFDVHYNGDGCAMAQELPPPSRASAVFLGDSFTEATQVPQDARFSSIVSRTLGLDEVNFGCSSFSPLLSRLQLDHFARRITPELVVLQLHANDVDGDLDFERVARRDARGRVVAVPGASTSTFVRLARHSYVARLVRRQWLQWRYDREYRRRNATAQDPAPWTPAFLRPITQAYASPEIERIEHNILAIRDWCADRHARFLVWVVPDRGSIRAGVPDHFHAHFERLARANGIAFFDAGEAFRREPLGALFFAVDVHLTARGHGVVARGVIEALRGTGAR